MALLCDACEGWFTNVLKKCYLSKVVELPDPPVRRRASTLRTWSSEESTDTDGEVENGAKNYTDRLADVGGVDCPGNPTVLTRQEAMIAALSRQTLTDFDRRDVVSEVRSEDSWYRTYQSLYRRGTSDAQRKQQSCWLCCWICLCQARLKLSVQAGSSTTPRIRGARHHWTMDTMIQAIDAAGRGDGFFTITAQLLAQIEQREARFESFLLCFGDLYKLRFYLRRETLRERKQRRKKRQQQRQQTEQTGQPKQEQSRRPDGVDRQRRQAHGRRDEMSYCEKLEIDHRPTGIGKSHATSCDPGDMFCKCRVAFVRHHLRDCSDLHPECRPEARGLEAGMAKLPTRLIAIGARAGQANLVETKSIAGNGHVQYATLSHCWGVKELLTLSCGNYDEFLRKIPVASLGRTFREAIEVCRRLDVGHLWIDCLCIIQDSPNEEDWRREALDMKTTYGNSLFNMAAAASRDASEGLLRSSFYPLQHHLVRTLPGGRRFGLCGGEMDHPLKDAFTRSPLYRRGWVLQEFFLSPRSLQFGEAELIWSCHRLMASDFDEVEVRGRVTARNMSLGTMVRFYEKFTYQRFGPSVIQSLKNLNFVWRRILLDFSGTSVTRSQDRYHALSGLVQLFERYFEDLDVRTRYVAGCWEHCLTDHLTWIYSEPSRTPDFDVYIPSWSWLRCSRVSDKLMSVPPDLSVNLKLHEIDLELEDEDMRFGPVKYARICFEACVFEYRRWPRSGPVQVVDDSSDSSSTGSADASSDGPDNARLEDLGLLFSGGQGVLSCFVANGHKSWSGLELKFNFDRADEMWESGSCMLYSVGKGYSDLELIAIAIRRDHSVGASQLQECYRRYGVISIKVNASWMRSDFEKEQWENLQRFVEEGNLPRKRVWLV